MHLLKEYVLFGPEAPEAAKAKALLERAQIQAPTAPFDILVRLGEWSEDENLFLLRHRIPQTFGGNVLNEVGEILVTASGNLPLHPQDRDLTFLHPLTIDSEYTRDVDDALSVEVAGGAVQVGIHITDVATFLNGRKDIFEEARQRAISIYLPDSKALIAGDVIFQAGVGRTDFPGGNGRLLKKSIDRLAQLDTEYLLPGHGDLVVGKSRVKRNFEYVADVYYGRTIQIAKYLNTTLFSIFKFRSLPAFLRLIWVPEGG